MHVFLPRRYQKIFIEQWARKNEINDGEHFLFMALRIGYRYV